MASLWGQSPLYDISVGVLWSVMLGCTIVMDTDVLAEALVQKGCGQSHPMEPWNRCDNTAVTMHLFSLAKAVLRI